MNILAQQKDNLIVQRALFLFFTSYNTHSHIIDEMEQENSGFAHAWKHLQEESKARHEKYGGMWIIHNYEIYLLFSVKLTYKAQALLIEKVMNAYGDKAKKDIEFSMEVDKIR